MSERERWIVYPLLFLALGAGLRDKLVDRTLSKDIVCQRLTIVGDDRGGQSPQPLIELGAAERASTTQPQYGHVKVAGKLSVQAIETGAVSANNYFYRHIPFAPNLLRAMPNPLRSETQRSGPPSNPATDADKRQEGSVPPAPQTPPAGSD
jgi:hypothetical protein